MHTEQYHYMIKFAFIAATLLIATMKGSVGSDCFYRTGCDSGCCIKNVCQASQVCKPRELTELPIFNLLTTCVLASVVGVIAFLVIRRKRSAAHALANPVNVIIV
jgi:hypothetical protein